jgi:intracellular sulfur oxidation DsrE/DsrF family protein
MRTRDFCATVVLLLALQTQTSLADDDSRDNTTCPVGLVSGMTLDTEFGSGTSAITHCLTRRHDVRLVLQINQYCLDNVPNSQCTRPFGLIHLTNMIDDYEITNGMVAGRDYQIVVVAHTAGGALMVKGNPFEGQVKTLMARGVKFYICQNATRALIRSGVLPPGNATANIIDGVEYVTAGVTAIVDFEARGYQYVQP